MSTPKKRFFLANPFDARSLARLFEQLTGKRVSQAEIDAAQKTLDARKDLTPSPRSDAPSSRCKERRDRGRHTRIANSRRRPQFKKPRRLAEQPPQ